MKLREIGGLFRTQISDLILVLNEFIWVLKTPQNPSPPSQEQLDKVFSELDGKNVNDVVAEGMGKLASVPSGGAAPAGGAAAAAGGDAAAPAEEKKEESEEESDESMGFDLFG